MKILVAYASRHGATQGIAERIGETLARRGLEVVVAPVSNVPSPEPYDAVVIGSAAYYGQWLKEATDFVRTHQTALAARPAWLFSSGPVGHERVDAKGRDVLAASEPREFEELTAAIQPRGRHVFFGAWNPEQQPIGFGESVMARFARLMPAGIRDQMPAGDFRDWPAIEAWSSEIADQLLAVREPVAAGA